MKSKHYVIFGDPVALARVRPISRGRVWDAQKEIKLTWGITFKKIHNNEPYFSAPVFMDIIFYMPIAKNLTEKRKAILRDQWHITRPDNSNMLKFIEDIAQKIAYHDDCIIAKHCVEKVYDDGKGPRVEFILTEMNGRRQHRELI